MFLSMHACCMCIMYNFYIVLLYTYITLSNVCYIDNNAMLLAYV